MHRKKIIIVILAFIALCCVFEFNHLLTLENAKIYQAQLSEYINNNFLLASVLFFVLYTVSTALSIPGSIILTLLGAALFGFWWSLLLVSFASSIGATIAFLFSRYLLRDWVQRRFSGKLQAINLGIKKDGTLYLLTLRLIPIFPFFIINLLMGLTPMSAKKYYLFSQLGMLPTTIVFLNTGTQLADINSLSGLLSPSVLMSLVVLGLLPLISKFIINGIKQNKVYQG
ncbi:MAG: putative membrane protein YdjX (TVP38/TMEM64 family) [Psychromonas sp.]|jgi:uncharacterized membrane protein YdjX (TVP38/TMEM64 family)|uniref:TVP38/TMEM64 family protein n=1 Tax=Psychromonas sp. TaxID=1884585 RepID=UPI0039E350C4